MQNLLAKALLEDICHPVSAVVSIGQGEQILGVHLFDTEFCGERMRVKPEAKEIWLMSNHEGGGKTPNEADVRNLCRVLQLARGRKVRVFFTSEYDDCMEMGLSEEEWDVL